MPWHRVKQGECISSIAKANGFLPTSLWQHSQNASLKNKRKDPNALKPGDRVFIPERTSQTVSAATDQKHTFVRKGAKTKVRLQVKRGAEILADELFTLDLDGTLTEIASDANGFVEVQIPADVSRGSITSANGKRITLRIGHLDPADEVSGAQARLNNLGFDVGSEDDVKGAKTTEGLRRFQKGASLTQTGELNQTTIAKLIEVHGS